MSTSRVVTTQVENVADAAGKLLRVPAILLQNAALIGLMMLIGFSLITIREGLILGAPYIAEYAVFFAAAFNALFFPIVDGVIAIIDVVKGVIYIIRKLLHKSTSTHFIKPTFTPVSAEMVRRFFSELPGRCVDYTNIGFTLSKATKAQTNEVLCPLVRYTYPVPWMWDLTNALFGWGIADAVPQGTFVPGGEQGNCELRQDPPDWLCISLSTGYLIVDILLPFLLVIILWPYTIGAILRLLYQTVKTFVPWVISEARRLI